MANKRSRLVTAAARLSGSCHPNTREIRTLITINRPIM